MTERKLDPKRFPVWVVQNATLRFKLNEIFETGDLGLENVKLKNSKKIDDPSRTAIAVLDKMKCVDRVGTESTGGSVLFVRRAADCNSCHYHKSGTRGCIIRLNQ